MRVNENLSFPDNWEKDLEQSLLDRPAGTNHKRVYICSPCRADTPEGVLRNMKAARAYMLYSYIHFWGIPKAPHAYLPVILNDSEYDEREIALEFGIRLLTSCDMVLVCGDRITGGMYGEILRAFDYNIPVLVFNLDAFNELKDKLASDDALSGVLDYHRGYKFPVLAMGVSELAAYFEASKAVEKVVEIKKFKKSSSFPMAGMEAKV